MGLTCKICFERASDQGGGSQARITPCGHVFCSQCASIWFRSDAPCPVCRHSISASSSLIPLFDHDSGVQSPSYGLAIDVDSGPVDCSTTSEDAQIGQGGRRDVEDGKLPGCASGRGSSKCRSNMDDSDSNMEQPEECCDDRPGVAQCLQKGSNDEEDVQVKYVLGKVAERWQQVVIERARLKVQVARLEKVKQDLVSQVQSLTEENMVLKQALHLRFRQTARSNVLDGSCWEVDRENSLQPESTCQGYDAETDGNGIMTHSNGCCSELSCNGVEAAYSPLRASPSRPPLKVEERLAATKWELGHTFSAHSGPVHGIAVSASGTLVATASWDHLCRVYDVHLDEEVSVLQGHSLGLYAVKFSPAKRDLVGTVSSDQTCRLWNTDTGDCLRVLEGHTDEVNGLSFKQGTHLLATASDDKSSMIWDAEKGISVTTLKGHRSGVYGVCFQPLGHLVATASFDFTAKLWDPRSAEDVQTLRGHLEDVIGVDIDDSGILVATGSDDKTCRVWDLRMGNPLAVLQEHSGEVKRVAFSPFGRLLATTSGDTTVRLFDTSTFECLHILSSHSDHVFDAAWSPSADFLVTASHDRLWKLWQPKVSSLRGLGLIASFNRFRGS